MEAHGLTRQGHERVFKFEGYGNKGAPYWFLGIEEGAGSIEQLRLRAESFDAVESLDAAFFKLGFDIFGYSPTLRVMSKLIMAMKGTSRWQEKDSAKEGSVARTGVA